jgi:hypothetical protein
MSLKCSSVSVNKMAMQNVWRHHFPQPGGGGVCCGTKGPTEVVEMAALYELIKRIDSSLSPLTHLWVARSDFFLHISPKKDT